MIRRTFTGHDRPLLESLLDRLRNEAEGRFPDLSRTALLLPTRNVGRKVRAALAARAGRAGRGILSPVVLTPGSLFTAIDAGPPPPPTAGLRLVAADEIARLSGETRAAAFGESPAGSLPERLSLARFFLETRKVLAEGLRTFGSVADDPSVGDRDRWNALAELDRAYRARLVREKTADPDDRAAALAARPPPDLPWERLVLAGAPDFPRSVAEFVRNLSGVLPVEAIVLADEDEAERFDPFGRPLRGAFEGSDLGVADDCLRTSRDVDEANASIADRLEAHPDSRAACVCGVGQPAAGAALAFELRERGLSAHDPAGRPFGSTPAGRFFRSLAGVCWGEEIADWSAWVRDPFVGRWIHRLDARETREDWIRRIDDRLEEVLPSTTADFLDVLAANRRPVPRIVSETRRLRGVARRAEDVFAALGDPAFRPLFDALEREEGAPEFADRLFALRRWLAPGDHDAEERANLARWAFEEAADFPVYPETSDGEIEILGWLELPWDERPWLQIPDAFDGSIPARPETHPLLPESLREKLGLPGRGDRVARDAYLLRALFRLRRQGGRIDLHAPRRDLEGNAVTPSRLLYYTGDRELPRRTRLLGRDPRPRPRRPSARKPAIAPAARHPETGWPDGLDRLGVTSFAAWIRCPFTFFLERVAGYGTSEPDRLEMDAAAFGNAVHDVLRALDSEDDSVDWERPAAVEAAALRLLDDWFLRRHGRRPGLLLELQREGLRRRLSAAASLRQTARAEGWRPLHVEWNFAEEIRLEAGGIPLSGKIDLVEARDDEIRIVDYKTSDNPASPEEAHRVRLSPRAAFTPSSLLPFTDDSAAGWKDLQLPLYAAALRSKYPDRRLRVAYGQLPSAVSRSRIAEWEDFDPAIMDGAIEAAETIIDLWRHRGFWPPTKAFADSDPYDWSGPDGRAAWNAAGLLDLRKEDSSA